MKYKIITLALIVSTLISAQKTDTVKYKKKVLENKELSFISSYYNQDGDNGAVGGGIGNEQLIDVTGSLILKLPIKDDGVLTIDAGLSAYTSASSSDVNPFDGASSASGGGEQTASPWVISSGASASDVYSYANLSYEHSSDDRNKIYKVNGGFSTEYDYQSFNFGLGYTHLLNEKNTELSISTAFYLDNWNAIHPTELQAFSDTNGSLSDGFFQGISITPNRTYNPENFKLITDTKRNSYSVSLSLSQILSPKTQISVFGDYVVQEGLLSTPFHRIYFQDKTDYFIEEYHLADDREILPSSRTKIPIGVRLNSYLTDNFILRTYYRFYTDNWGMTSHTASVEVPIKISPSITISPNYRFYNQTEVDYFKPYNQHLSTAQYYTSDYDLSTFDAHTIGAGIRIAPQLGIWNFGKKFSMKSIDLRYQNYSRSNSLSANIITLGVDFSL